MKAPATSKEVAMLLAKLHSLDLKLPIVEPAVCTRLKKWSAAAGNAFRALEKKSDTNCMLLATIKSAGLLSDSEDCTSGAITSLCNVLTLEGSQVVFCHHDCIAGNIMRHRETRKLKLIDYEYGEYDYRGMDLANHFAEWTIEYGIEAAPHFVAKPVEWYPSESTIKAFLETYAKATLKRNCDAKDREAEIGAFVTALRREVAAFAMAADVLWGLWSLVQAATSSIKDFDYIAYALTRFQHYAIRKQEWEILAPKAHRTK